MTDDIGVSVWNHVGSNNWRLTGQISNYVSLEFSPTFLDDGSWDMEVPYDDSAQPLTAAKALVTIDFRGVRSTWRVIPEVRWNEEGERVLAVTGSGALSLLGGEPAWPDPTKTLAAQTTPPVGDPKLYSGSAETVVRSLVNENYIGKGGNPLDLLPDAGRGAASRARGRWTNLKELVTKKADVGGIGVDVGLVSSTASSARLVLRVWSPVDRSRDVYLSEQVGTLTSASAVVTPPTLTEAIVSGAGGIYKLVTTSASLADAAQFGRYSALVAGPSSYDDSDLQQAGEEALKEGASKVDVTLTVADTDGLVAFRDYQVGDLATGQLETGLSIVDNISSIKVAVAQDSPLTVTPTFGNPTNDDPVLTLAQLIRSQDRRLRAQEQKG